MRMKQLKGSGKPSEASPEDLAEVTKILEWLVLVPRFMSSPEGKSASDDINYSN